MFHTQGNQKKEKLQKKTAGADIIGHGEYHAEENAFFFLLFSSWLDYNSAIAWNNHQGGLRKVEKRFKTLFVHSLHSLYFTLTNI